MLVKRRLELKYIILNINVFFLKLQIVDTYY